MTRPSLLIPTLLAALIIPTVAAGAPSKPVTRNLVKVGVDKVLSVRLAPTQPADKKVRDVVLTMAGTGDKCSNTGAEVFAFPEGDFEGFEYVSYWVAGAPACAAAPVPLDVVHTMRLAVGKNHKLVLVGPKKFNQRVSFRLAENAVASLLIKKALAR